MGGPAFYLPFAQAARNLKSLDIYDDETVDDACVAALCAQASLEQLTLHDSPGLTGALIDGILAGKSAATLRKVCFYNVAESAETPIRGADILHLIERCPKLRKVTWHVAYEFQAAAAVNRATHDAIVSHLFLRLGPGASIHMGHPHEYSADDGYLRVRSLGSIVDCRGM